MKNRLLSLLGDRSASVFHVETAIRNWLASRPVAEEVVEVKKLVALAKPKLYDRIWPAG